MSKLPVLSRAILLATGTCLCATSLAEGLVRVRLPAGPGPLDNPLKGYAAFTEGETYRDPVSMAYHNVSWRELEPREGQYAFEAWEKRAWENPLSKGKHIVFRVYLDYPTLPSGVPPWLLDQGVKTTPYSDYGGGQSPDYEDPRLRAALARFIAALGKRYDQNPRVAFVQLGLLGHWGEWHTYPRPELFASPTVQSMVVESMRRAFPHKHLLARNPASPAGKDPTFGFHDDMIPADTDGPEEWKFLPAIRAAGRVDNWKEAPRGGEMVPGAAKQYLGKEWPVLMASVERAHFSFIGPYCPALVPSDDPQFRSRSHQLIRKLGYEYRLVDVEHPRKLRVRRPLSIVLTGMNQGLAPFYYPWRLSFALVDGKGRVAQRWATTDDIRKWLPGMFKVSTSVPLNVPAGTYQLAVGIVDPWKQVPSIGFANSLQRVGGYTVLSKVEVAR
jgi:hypothetical protein